VNNNAYPFGETHWENLKYHVVITPVHKAYSDMAPIS
jgi:hypothetical protein